MNTTSFDSLNLLLENLRFISSSNLNAITSRSTTEWTIYISLISLFIAVSGIAIQFKKSYPKKLKLIWTVFISVAILGCFLFLIISRGHYKDGIVYKHANNQIVNALETNNLISKEEKSCLLGQPLLKNYPHIGAYATCTLQAGIIILFASLAAYILTRNKKE
jgi:hypothetical protein